MKKLAIQLFIIITLSCVINSDPSIAQTSITDSLVSGTWIKANSPYLIQRDIYIEDGASLVIDSGVTVEFQGHFKLDVQGRLLAIGTETDSIVFTVNDTTGFHLTDTTLGGWDGMKFDNTPETNDTSKFKYCVFSFVRTLEQGGVLHIEEFPKISISNSLFINNTVLSNNSGIGGVAIYLYLSKAIIENNKFINNKAYTEKNATYGGAVFANYSDIILNGNIFKNNYASHGGAIGILTASISDIRICNNLIYNNASIRGGGLLIGGINTYNCYISNNTIVNNSAYYGGGIAALPTIDSLHINNSIIWNNSAPDGNEILLDSETDMYLNYCCIKNESQSFYLKGNGELVQNNCISFDPRFNNISSEDFRLTDSSYCINGGTPDTTGLYLTSTDFTGNPRIYDDDADIVDIGAFEYQGIPVNRLPLLTKTKDQYILTSDSISLTVEFYDFDFGDTWTITTISLSPKLEVKDLSGDTTGSTYALVPKTGWAGLAELAVTVTDQSSEITTINTDTFGINVGDLWGEINVDSILQKDTVNVCGNVTVADGTSLTIPAGTIINFVGDFNFDIQGRILARGTETDSIKFTIPESMRENGWNGIKFNSTPVTNDTSKFEYCIFEYSKVNTFGGAFYISNFSKISINSSVFNNNYSVGDGGAIYSSYSNSKIFNNKFFNNQSEEDGGAICSKSYDQYIINNIFYNNSCIQGGGAIYTIWASTKIINNTFFNNSANYGGAMYLRFNLPELLNNISWNNEAFINGDQIFIYNADIKMRYNNIQSGLSGIYGTPDVNENNIDIEPQFMDYNNNDFRLKSISPCINAGIPVTTGLGLPITDISGNERIFDGEVDIIDIGAYEFQDHPSPWDIVISNDSIEENSTPCNIVGILYTLHQDSTTTYTYTFDKDSVNPDTLFFSVSNDTLNTSNNLLDYEYKPIDNIYIKTTDNRGKSYTELISIQIINENEIPTGLALSKDSITENSAIGSIVGILNTTDEDISDTHNYTFASGDGINDMDSIYFDTDNNNLITKAEINFEAQQECKIVIRTTDGGGLFYDKPFVIYIININEPPVEINLSNDSIKYDAEPGTLVGEFSTIDEDINDTDHTYTFTSDEFVNSADSIYFNILDDSLLVAMDLDNEKLVYEFLVKSTDNGGLSLTEQFLINVIKAENIKLIKQLPGYIQIYPNPAKGYIIINPKEKQKTIEEIILINSQGEVVFSAYSLNTVNYNLDINDFSNGIYYLVIKLEGKYYYDKIIIFQ